MDDPRQPGWRAAMVRMGYLRSQLAITAFSIVVSVLLTLLLLQDPTMAPDMRIGALITAAVVPAMVAPLASHFMLTLAFELDTAHTALAETARRDALTGVFNRRYFMEEFDRELSRAERSLNPLTLLLIDADHFKRINDEHGHATGDDVLRHLAQSITGSMRPYDRLARYGGEEFVAVLPGATLDEAYAVAERVRDAVAASPFSLRNGEPLRVTVSVGVSELQPGDRRGTAMFDRADSALYRAKDAGRNRCLC
jgi:diguanylate cyclase (GGDEF)-like protein